MILVLGNTNFWLIIKFEILNSNSLIILTFNETNTNFRINTTVKSK